MIIGTQESVEHTFIGIFIVMNIIWAMMELMYYFAKRNSIIKEPFIERVTIHQICSGLMVAAWLIVVIVSLGYQLGKMF